MNEIFLHPGEYHVGHEGCRISTVLGSCVSITLWHPGRRIGAMSHFVLSSRSPRKPGALDARYAEDALLLMLGDLADEGVNPRECQAKLFGGGNMFPGYVGGNIENVGQKNGETARMLMRTHGVPVVSESLFGVGHRHLIFDIASGNVWLRQTKGLAGAPTELA